MKMLLNNLEDLFPLYFGGESLLSLTGPIEIGDKPMSFSMIQCPLCKFVIAGS